MRHVFLLIAALLIGCSDSSSTPATAASSDASAADVLSNPTDPGCQETSFTQVRTDPPTDTCLQGASCRFSVNNGVAGCYDGGATSYPIGPVNWTCACETDGRWDCNVDPSSADAATAACP